MEQIMMNLPVNKPVNMLECITGTWCYQCYYFITKDVEHCYLKGKWPQAAEFERNELIGVV